MLSGGEIMIPGVGLSTMFYKGAFDKIGVEADYIQIGAYKGAKEPYTQTGPSEELKGELNRLTDNLYAQIVDGIATYRHLSTDAVKAIIDETILTGDNAKTRGLIDHVIDQDGMRALIKEKLNHDIDLIRDYGQPAREQLDFSNPFALLSMLTKRPDVASTGPCVAVIYAEGVITDGEAGGGLFGGGGGVASDPMRRAFRMAARDDSVKAIVIRIDSPGGSALASEVMWQGLRHLAEKKPVIISVGSMAASGGYYLASAGDTIYADPCGIVGSIGVVGGKFVLKDLYAKLGLNTQTFAKGQNAGLFSSDAPFSDQQKTMVQHWMEQTYHQFTQRVLTTRSQKIKDIEQVAQGRIFVATQAKELGLVDEIGGTEAAIACAADRAGLAEGKYEVRTLPPAHSLADLLSGGSEDAASPIHPRITISPESILGLMDASTRELLTQQLAAVQLLQKRPVMLMSPFVFTTR
jgi:protease-4